MIVGSPPINDPLSTQGRLNRVWAKWFSNLGRIKSAGAVSDVASPDATDLATVITLANETKAQFNTLLANLRTAGLLDE